MGLLGGLLGKKKDDDQGNSPLGGLLGGLAGLLGQLDVGQLADSAMVGNVVAQVAERVGIPSETAQTVVEYALEKLLPLLTGQAKADDTPDLAELAQHVLASDTFDVGALVDNQHVQELAGKAGIDQDVARNGLSQAVDLLMEQLGSGGLDVGGLLGGLGG